MKRLLPLLVLLGCESGGDSPPEPPVAECSAFLQWVAPTERADGTPLPLSELSKFTVYVSESPEPEDMLIEMIIDISDPNVISWEVFDLSHQHWFWVTATDTENRESGPSNVVAKDCPS